jgi:hypothetical protein
VSLLLSSPQLREYFFVNGGLGIEKPLKIVRIFDIGLWHG